MTQQNCYSYNFFLQEEYNLIVLSEIQVIIHYEIIENFIETNDEYSDLPKETTSNDSEDNVTNEDIVETEDTSTQLETREYVDIPFGNGVYRYYYDTREIIYIPNN